MKRIGILFTLMILSLGSIAQQFPIHTNYLFNDQLYNPATSGMDHYLEGKASVRKQWLGLEGSPTTLLVGAEAMMPKSPISAGGYILSDATGALGRTGLTLTGAYELDLGDQGNVRLGLAAGIYRLQLDQDINVQDIDDKTLIQAQSGRWLPDVNVGLLYTHNRFYAGLSVPQFLQTKADFVSNGIESVYRLERSFYLMTGYRYQATERIEVEPMVLLRYARPGMFQGELMVKGTFDNKFWLGGLYRTSDAAAVMAGMQINDQLEVGYAYDITLSPLRTHGSGSHELMVGFKLAKPDKPEEPEPKKLDKKQDSDEDGLTDDVDECPYTKGPIENNGCPIVEEDEQQTLDLAIQNLEFQWDKDIIEDTSKPHLDKLADLLKEKSDWNFYIAGHTDNSGTEEYNFKLSKDRAYAVMEYLRKKGIAKERMTVEFFGEYMPIDTNDTPEGRARNRRVEMEFVFD